MGSLLQIGATCAILYYFLKQNYVVLVQYAGLESEIESILFRELKILISVISVTFAVYLVGVAVLGIVFSHRIAGAIYALKRTIKEINDGGEAVFKLRPGDEFQELVDSFNQMVSNLKAGSSGSQNRN